MWSCIGRIAYVIAELSRIAGASTVYFTLVDSRTHEKLYTEKFMYGYHNPFMSGTDIDAPSTYHFKNRDSLFSDSKKLVAGMENSITSVSGSVVSKLSK